MTRARKLLLVTDAPNFGGAERYLLDMASAAQRRGLKSAICWLRAAECSHDIFESARAAGTRVHEIAAASGLFDLLGTFRGVLRQECPDAAIFNACGRSRFWTLPWMARAARIPTAWVHHMVDPRDPRRLPPKVLGGRLEGLHAWRVPQTLRHTAAAAAATAVITSNQCDRDYVARWHRVRPDHLHVIPPGIDLERFQPAARPPSSDSEFVIGTAARLTRGKGVEMLIESVALLASRGVNICARIAGTGPDEAQFRWLVRDRHVEDRVEFAGFQRDMAAFYGSLDVFTLCSDTESFGLAISEAMACGCAVVATPTAGSCSQISDGVNGRLLPSHTPVALAEALFELNNNAQLREAIGKRARADVLSGCDIEETLERTLRLLMLSQTALQSPSKPCAIKLAAEDLR